MSVTAPVVFSGLAGAIAIVVAAILVARGFERAAPPTDRLSALAMAGFLALAGGLALVTAVDGAALDAPLLAILTLGFGVVALLERRRRVVNV